MYYIEDNNQIVLFDEDKNKLETTIKFMPQYSNLPILETDRPIVDFQFADTPEYLQEQEAKEQARIAMLNLTGADVERAIYKVKGIDFDDILTMLQTMPMTEGETPEIDLKALKIELKANNFYRGNPYIDAVGTVLGFSKSQLDKFFEAGTSDDAEVKAYAYKYLTKVNVTINATPDTATVYINGEEGATLDIEYGQSVQYTVSADGYMSATGDIESITEDTTVNVELVELPKEDITPDEYVEDSTTDSIEGDTEEVSPDNSNEVTEDETEV